jgi:outer membrane protein assembly factor BamB
MRTIALFIITLVVAQAIAAGPQGKKDRRKSEGAHPNRKDSGEGRLLSSSPLALPFKRSWQYLTENASTHSPTIDGQRIYLPLAGGRVVCLDRETGSLNWTSEPGGFITSSIATSEKAVFVATRKMAEDGSDSGASVKSLDKETGLTLWAGDYPRAFTSPLVLDRANLYAGSADGFLYALSAESGDVIWKVSTQDSVHGRALVTGEAVYFGSDDGALRAVEPVSGKEIWKFQTGGKVRGRPAIGEKNIYFGSGDGHVYAVELATQRLKWRSRTGAAVEASVVLAGDRVLAASFDNFIYALDPESGDRVWKRRVDNRIAAEPIIVGDATMIAPLRGRYVAVFLNTDGRSINFFQLDRGVELVADPVFSDDTLAIATDRGLVVAKTTQKPEARSQNPE